MYNASEGGTLDFDDGDDQRIFWGLKFLIAEFFSVGKFGKYFFGWLDLIRHFFVFPKQSEDSRYCCLCWMHSSANKVSPNFSFYTICLTLSGNF